MMDTPDRIRRQSSWFFALLYLLAAFLIWRQTNLLRPLNPVRGLILAAGFALTLAAGPFLTPVFKVVTALTRRLGSLIFGLISLLVYFLILSPLAMVMRLGGKQFLSLKDEGEETWYQDWAPGESPDKQY